MDERTLDTPGHQGSPVENWAVWRDSGDWERFRTVWHEDGVMMATWFQGTFEEVHSREPGRLEGGGGQHPASASAGRLFEIAGNRAIAANQNDPISLNERWYMTSKWTCCAPDGLLRFLVEKRSGPAGAIVPAAALLRKRTAWTPSIRSATGEVGSQNSGANSPKAYKHLALPPIRPRIQVSRLTCPGLKGPDADALYAKGKKWLAGGPALE